MSEVWPIGLSKIHDLYKTSIGCKCMSEGVELGGNEGRWGKNERKKSTKHNKTTLTR